MAESEKMNVVMPKYLKRKAEDLAEAFGINLSEFVRDAIKEKIDRDEVKMKKHD